jgi:DNA mismatch repair protein MLH1
LSRIAAGEVVQRPASAVKELIENSLDAGSANIMITVKHGGLQLLQIEDDGHGICKDDFGLVCERFATSKISTYEDLSRLCSFGFRGEALASISHVAHIQIVSRTVDASYAYRAKYADGKLISPLLRAAGKIGTTITVEDLYYNMAARRQAFKNGAEEFTKILNVVMQYSIRFPRTSFTLKKFGVGSPEFCTPSDSSSFHNIKLCYGALVAKELLDVDMMIDDEATLLNVKIEGKISSINFSSRRCIFVLFINDRLIEDSTIKRVVESIYQEFLPKHAHPFIYLSIR